MKQFITLSLFVLAIVAAGPVSAANDLKIGVVDFQKSLNSVNEGKRAKKNLESEFKRKQKQLEIQQEELKKMRDNLKNQAAVLSEEKLRTKQAAFQQKFMDLRKKAVEYQQEMAKKEAEMSNKILGQLRAIVEDLGKKEGFTLIVERSGDPVLYVDGKEDLTDRVVKLYNKKY